ncbi:MAG TPA: hypothetical protein EYP14_06085 [Planctomycetaceae bacterium]|nr:hypothetical protein [Planctomycetaceae bacterium]
MVFRRSLQAASWLALAVVVGAPTAYLFDGMPLDVVQAWMLGGTVVWFLATPFWMGRPAGTA